MSPIWVVVTCFLLNGIAEGRKGFGPGEQEWGYIDVRPGAHMFWWLYYVTPPSGEKVNVYKKPLVIWLQGGPGASSTGYGNFEELGPLDLEGNRRNYTWVNDYNVLFIDNPVGSGFSYVENTTAFATTNKQIADDLLKCMKGFLDKFPGFQKVPTYVTAESYGGKMAAELGLVWYKAQKAGSIKSNLSGVALGDSWISPMDSVMSWAPFLLSTGMIDRRGVLAIEKAAVETQRAVDEGRWRAATSLWAYTENVIVNVTGNIDFYNILEKKQPRGRTGRLLPGVRPKVDRDRMLSELMNNGVRNTLGLNVSWGLQSSEVFNILKEDFMKPVVNIVQQLTNQTNLEVFVFTGQLDLIVATLGTVEWVERMFKDVAGWSAPPRRPVVVNNVIEGYLKEYKNFKMYWINRAGHMVPRDNPYATASMLKHLTGSK
ncbi:retinoid-inducible serine carboxypeptidase [Diachasma alloeum]|uniref:retinoid-inducible serine carboxypeptidase n=1 Tax=Diachasma alloeum TaxID=454923 RepID=UPI0007382A1E|nr:retinoid-inducible serine carboxypeptidase [Diachasma alloeum]